ncbi:MAG TPA: hypothetical protein VN281_06105 [Verrucomicrobiae bacterium]|nr:hypothetical protein [Verrucomicrobiae bacterium]
MNSTRFPRRQARTLSLVSLLAAMPIAVSAGSQPAVRQKPAPPTAIGNAPAAAPTPPPGAANAPGPVQSPLKAEPDQAGSSSTVNLKPAQTNIIDFGTFTLGGSVYSTGAGDVVVQILDSNMVRPLPRGHNKPDLSPFNSGLWLLSPGQPRYIGSNHELGKTVNLGTFPAGVEVVLALKVDDYNCFLRTGNPTNNIDNLDHVIFRTFSRGAMELWFEDAPGPLGWGRSDRDFNDLVISLGGGVDRGAVAGLLQAIQVEKGPDRDNAIAALRRINPQAAANYVAQKDGPAN